MNTLALALDLFGAAPTQYSNFPFRSMGVFNGKPIACGDGGIFELTGDTDQGTAIAALVDLPVNDFGTRKQKRLRTAAVGYETGGSLTLTLTPDEGTGTAYTLPRRRSAQVQQSAHLPLQRTAPGRYWSVRIENVSGCDFSLDELEIRPIILGDRPRG